MKKHWQTTTIGVLMIVGCLAQAGASYLQGHHVDTGQMWACLVGGIGFLRAADVNKTP